MKCNQRISVGLGPQAYISHVYVINDIDMASL